MRDSPVAGKMSQMWPDDRRRQNLRWMQCGRCTSRNVRSSAAAFAEDKRVGEILSLEIRSEIDDRYWRSFSVVW